MTTPASSGPHKFAIGDRVQTNAGIGRIEFIAYSNAMQSPIYTVAIDRRTTLRLHERDLRRAA